MFSGNIRIDISLLNQYLWKLSKKYSTPVIPVNCTTLNEEEKALIERKSEYVEGYNDIKAYTKLGPIENSYIV